MTIQHKIKFRNIENSIKIRLKNVKSSLFVGREAVVNVAEGVVLVPVDVGGPVADVVERAGVVVQAPVGSDGNLTRSGGKKSGKSRNSDLVVPPGPLLVVPEPPGDVVKRVADLVDVAGPVVDVVRAPKLVGRRRESLGRAKLTWSGSKIDF